MLLWKISKMGAHFWYFIFRKDSSYWWIQLDSEFLYWTENQEVLLHLLWFQQSLALGHPRGTGVVTAQTSRRLLNMKQLYSLVDHFNTWDASCCQDIGKCSCSRRYNSLMIVKLIVPGSRFVWECRLFYVPAASSTFHWLYYEQRTAQSQKHPTKKQTFIFNIND